MLGDLMARLEEPGAAEEALVEAGELLLLTRVRAEAEHSGMSVGAYCSSVVRRFVDTAGDGEWLQLVGAMNRSDTPGLAALGVMLDGATGAPGVAA